MSIRAVPSSATMTTTRTPVACHVGMASTIRGSTITTDLTDGIVLGTMAAGTEVGMILGTMVMPVGTIHGIMATMAGAGLTATDGTAGGDLPTITTGDIPVVMLVQPIIGITVAAASTMRRATDPAMVGALQVVTSLAIVGAQVPVARTMHVHIL